jgi:nicotinate-nucleotide adenylyltransferase
MTEAPRLGILGGTFDPIHFGHLDAADAARSTLGLSDIVFIPSHDPPHRPIDPHATGFHRFALIALALAERPGYSVSDIELKREGASFTIDTLRTLHGDGWRPAQLFFILGADAFAEIATWREYPGVLDAANFVVIARPGTTAEAALARNPELMGRLKPDLTYDAQTHIIIINAPTRDVSSTRIRERLAAGQSIDDLVPAAVAQHIHRHHLYGAVGRLHGEDQSANQ